MRPGILLLIALLAGCSSPELAGLPDQVDYNFHIKPILSDRCYTCHGPDDNAREADLRLDTENGPYAKLESGQRPIVPRRLNRSEVWNRITHSDPEEIMPPLESNLSLSDYEIALIGKWIEQGAKWKPHWAFTPPENPKLPRVRNRDWPTNDIDHFVLAKLEEEGLEPAPRATRERLLRRASFDLTGLPPSLESLDAFLADSSETAYETAIDHLLASPSFGERMANEWLDVARYADTGGYQSDRVRRMWPWRDWVIEAFNDNLPYDEFITWQLAGDLLPDASQTQIMATAFNRNHRQTEEGGSIEEEFRTEYVADRVNTLGTAFLGLTLECARCHDHKYDPVSQKEYYQLFDFFNDIDESGQTSFFTDAVPVPTLLLTDEQQDHALDSLRQQIRNLETDLAAYSASTQAEAAQFMISDAAAQSKTLQKGLVAHFPLDRIAEDETPNRVNPSRPGTRVFEPRMQPGKRGNAVLFDGEDGFTFEDVGRFRRTDPFSVDLWIKAGEWNEWNVLVHRTMAALDAGSRGYELALQEDRLVAGLAHMWPQNAIRVVTQNGLPLNEWIHITMTYDGSSRADGIQLYVNGELQAVEVVRDNLFKNITYERGKPLLTLGHRFRDTGFRNGLIDELRLYNRTLSPIEAAQLAERDPWPVLLAAPNDANAHDVLQAHYQQHYDAEYDQRYEALREAREALNTLIAPIPEIMVMKDMEAPRPAYVLERGQYDLKKEEVQPGTPAQIMPFAADAPANRLGLAQWLTDPQHPLTARVAVNRYWQLLFGKGLVNTPDDFGNQGALPSHPALLDWLATEFIDSGWDLKHLMKLMLTSATYQQASEADSIKLERDPENILLARGPSYRLPAEMIRDQALQTSGLLVKHLGGPSVKPVQPAGLWEEKSGQKYVPDNDEGRYRRSLYTYWKRTSPPPNMTTMDAGERNNCVVKRQATSTPLQSLVLLNDPQFTEASRHLGERMLSEGGAARDEQLQFAFRLLTSRYPTPAELAILQALYEEQHDGFAAHPERASALIASSGEATEFDEIALATSTVVANALLNFDETIYKR